MKQLALKDQEQVYDSQGQRVNRDELPIDLTKMEKSNARKNTLSYPILMKHNTSKEDTQLKIRFDALTSHDIIYVGIVQTARASGLKEFPLPYVLPLKRFYPEGDMRPSL